MEHPVELMMAVVVASTSLLGLTGVLIGQIKSSLGVLPDIKGRWILALIMSFVMGLLTIGYAIMWFSTSVDHRMGVALTSFITQILLFVIVASYFWFKGVKKVPDLSMKKPK